MNIKKERAQGVVGYDICDIRPVEMKYMVDMCNRVKNILDNHQNKDAQKEYLSDDDLKKIWAILSVFTRESDLSTRPSEFETFLAEQEKQAEKPADATVEKPEEKPYGTF